MRSSVRSAELGCLALAVLALPVAGNAALFTDTDPKNEIALGRQVAAEIERSHALSADQTLQHRVNRVGFRIAEQFEPRMYPYEFRVLASEQINAFALPGGFIFINEGLLAHIPNDDALAWVLAHEMTHSAHRHWAKIVGKMKGVEAISIIVSVAGGTYGSLIATLANQLMSASYSRGMENEADKAGLEYMWRAGFDPQGAIQAMEMIEKLCEGPKVPKYLRDHPPPKQRKARLEGLCERLEEETRPKVGTDQMARPASDTNLVAAVGDITGIEIAQNEWFPLQVGNQWTYDVAQGDGGRTSYTVRVISALPAGGGTVYRVECAFGQDTCIASQMLTTVEAVWRRPRPTEADSEWLLEFVTGAPTDKPVERDGWQYQRLDDELITLKCGSFEGCLVVSKRGGEPVRTQKLWFVRDIGLVKRVCEETGVTETLIQYTIPSPEGEAPEQ